MYGCRCCRPSTQRSRNSHLGAEADHLRVRVDFSHGSPQDNAQSCPRSQASRHVPPSWELQTVSSWTALPPLCWKQQHARGRSPTFLLTPTRVGTRKGYSKRCRRTNQRGNGHSTSGTYCCLRTDEGPPGGDGSPLGSPLECSSGPQECSSGACQQATGQGGPHCSALRAESQ